MQTDNLFLNACKNGQKSVVMTFLKKGGINVDKRDESGFTPLYYASLKAAAILLPLCWKLELMLHWQVMRVLRRCTLLPKTVIKKLSACWSNTAPISMLLTNTAAAP